MKNTLTNLNDHLFAQIERLGEEGLSTDDIATEVSRAGAIVNVSDQIIKNADIHLKAVKMKAEYGPAWMKDAVPMIEGKKEESPQNQGQKMKAVK